MTSRKASPFRKTATASPYPEHTPESLSERQRWAFAMKIRALDAQRDKLAAATGALADQMSAAGLDSAWVANLYSGALRGSIGLGFLANAVENHPNAAAAELAARIAHWTEIWTMADRQSNAARKLEAETELAKLGKPVR